VFSEESDLTGLTGLARFPALLLREAGRMGMDRAALMRAAGLSASAIQDPDRRIPMSRTVALWRAVIAEAPEPPLGLRIGSKRTLREAGLVGYVLQHSGTLRRGLERFTRYVRIISEAQRAEMRDDEECVRLMLEGHPLLDAMRHPADARLAWTLAAAREMTGAAVAPIAVCFPHQAPEELAEYHRFFRCALRFGEKAALLLRSEDLDLPVIGSDETLGGYLEHLAEEALRSLGSEGSFADRLRRALWADLPGGPPTLRRTSERLGVSVRTLQRRLEAEKTSFGSVLEALRRDMGERLLREKHLAVCEVAFLFGYSESGAFVRAFRRWKGTTPARFRGGAA
jgi:AraC-like DNA-binding protein